MITDSEIALRLLVAGILGGIIGYERQAKHKAAGLRTHTLVGIGSCLIMILSISLYETVQGKTNADPARLAAQVVSGIGFLGAGSIMKEGLTVKGLTTAASLWVVSGVGLAAGGGFYVSALMTTLLVFSILVILTRMEARLYSKQFTNMVVTSEDRPEQIGAIGACLGCHGVNIRDIKIEENNHLLLFHLLLQLPDKHNMNCILANLAALPGVKSVACDSAGMVREQELP